MSDATTATGTAADPILDLVKYQKELSSKKTASTEKTTSTLGKDEFMQLLVTQLRYQDPLSPQDNQQMAAQMAQFSSLESLQNVQKSIEALGTTFTEMAGKQSDAADAVSSGSATSMLGKTARFQVDDIALPATGSQATVSVHAAAGSTALIKNADGEVVRSIPLGSILKNGEGVLSWDGNTDKGVRAASGSYSLSIVDQATQEKSGYGYEDAAIVGVSFDDQGPVLRTANGSYRMTKLVEIGSDKKTDTPASEPVATQRSAADKAAETTASIALIGKRVSFRDTSAELDGSKDAEWTFTAAAGSIGQILDSTGTVVHSFSVDAVGGDGKAIMDEESGTGKYAWNGKINNQDLPQGTYHLRIVDPTATTTMGTTFREVDVEGIVFDAQGNPKLVSENGYWSFSDLFTI
ncbi:MAG TPA: flagellar hook assembly protein FlgD [Fibrobacteria bacterium]|mgnify:CR=1 FL=1|nr:flagellar hook assembly protein FlgD [Fibrobacteria bacterium]